MKWQISAERILLLLGLLHRLLMMVMVVVMSRVIGMQRRGRLSLHEGLSVETERTESLARQIHGRSAWMMFSGHCSSGCVVKTHLRLRQMSCKVMMRVRMVRVVRMMRMVSWHRRSATTTHQRSRRSGTRSTIIITASN